MNRQHLAVLLLVFGMTQNLWAAPCAESSAGLKTGDDILVLVNKEIENQLRPEWQPTDLKPIPPSWMAPTTSADQLLRAEALEAYAQMLSAAQKSGIKFYIQSAYRSFKSQCGTFAAKVEKWTGRYEGLREKGLAYARKSSAEPGRSQHQLGTTVDIVFASLGYKFSFQMDKTAELKWLKENAHHFGFVMSYPFADDDHDGLGYNAKTGYYYEPWHWRYIGAEAATEFIKSGLTLDEYLQRK